MPKLPARWKGRTGVSLGRTLPRDHTAFVLLRWQAESSAGGLVPGLQFLKGPRGPCVPIIPAYLYHLFIHLYTVHLAIHLLPRLFCLSIHLPIHLAVHLSIIHPSIHLPVHLVIHLSICLQVFIALLLFAYLFMPQPTACGILAPDRGRNPSRPAVEPLLTPA